LYSVYRNFRGAEKLAHHPPVTAHDILAHHTVM